MPANLLFIGLGNMGEPMAQNLLAAGYTLSVFDLDKKRGDALVKNGALWANDLKASAAKADVVMTSLPGPPQVLDAILNKGGVLDHMQKGATLIDTTTSSVELAKDIAEKAKTLSLQYLEAPITNATDAAREGRLTIFVAGDQKVFNSHKAIFDVIGKTILHVGAYGNGAITKLITNLLWFVNAAAIGEGLMMGAKAGIPLQTIQKAITESAGNSWVAEHDIPSIFAGHYDPSFSLDLCCKDLGLAQKIAESQGLPLKMGKRAGELFEQARKTYGGDAAELHVVKLLEDEMGVLLRPDAPSNDQ